MIDPVATRHLLDTKAFFEAGWLAGWLYFNLITYEFPPTVLRRAKSFAVLAGGKPILNFAWLLHEDELPLMPVKTTARF